MGGSLGAGDGIAIRRLAIGDEALVVSASDLFDGPALTGPTARFLRSDDHHLLVALDGDVPVGFVTGVEITHPDKGTEMLLYELSVAESHRRRGIGTALVRALLALAVDRGCRGMWVLTEAGDDVAVATYRRAGATSEEAATLLEWGV